TCAVPWHVAWCESPILCLPGWLPWWYVRLACFHGKLACLHVKFACLHVQLGYLHVKFACSHVQLGCLHARLACLHAQLACFHVRIARFRHRRDPKVLARELNELAREIKIWFAKQNLPSNQASFRIASSTCSTVGSTACTSDPSSHW